MSADELLVCAGRKIDAIADDTTGAGPEPVSAGDLVRESLSALDARIAAGESLSKDLSTGYVDLDKFTGGLRAGGALIVLGLRGRASAKRRLGGRTRPSASPRPVSRSFSSPWKCRPRKSLSACCR